MKRKQFGRRKPYIDRDAERAAAAKVAILTIFGGCAAFGLGYWLDDPNGASVFAFLIGFGLLFVALAAAGEAFGHDPDEEV
jgi:hydrogenase/urease accessory protein HupE